MGSQLGWEHSSCASDFQQRLLKTACFQGFQDKFIPSAGTVLLQAIKNIQSQHLSQQKLIGNVWRCRLLMAPRG